MVVTVDRSVGRLVTLLEDLGELDNTLIVFTSDNGASAEGGAEGTRSYYRMFPHTLAEFGWQGDTPLDESLIGGRDSAAHYPRGWAQASNTPFRYYKGQTFAGGVRVPFIASWPGAPQGMAGVREQYSYVTDVVPTILDLVGIEHPGSRPNAALTAPDGVSVAEAWARRSRLRPHAAVFGDLRPPRAVLRRMEAAVPLRQKGSGGRARVAALRHAQRPHRAARPVRRASPAGPGACRTLGPGRLAQLGVPAHRGHRPRSQGAAGAPALRRVPRGARADPPRHAGDGEVPIPGADPVPRFPRGRSPGRLACLGRGRDPLPRRRPRRVRAVRRGRGPVVRIQLLRRTAPGPGGGVDGRSRITEPGSRGR